LSDEVVKLTEATSEAEAVEICGYLEENGIKAAYDTGGVEGFDAVGQLGVAFGGGQEILVRAEDEERARKLLEELRQP
jgi:Putative prokaryotic signal transducing protein